MRKIALLLVLITASSAHAYTIRKMEFATIKAKTFLMGSADSENGRSYDESLHMVSISKDFEIQTTPVTQLQWVEVMGENPSEFKNKLECKKDFFILKNISMCANYPVENVSFKAALEFIQKLNTKDSTYSYRLPTEAEWELAARGGTGSSYFFSDDGTNFDKFVVSDSLTPSKVASKRPNQFGLYDMLGNISQWVNDYYSYYPELDFENPTLDPQGPNEGDYRIVRGGDWAEYRWNFFRSAKRTYVNALDASSHIGFRLVRTRK